MRNLSSLGDSQTRRNSLNLVRFLLAGAVILQHAIVIAGFQQDDYPILAQVGNWAVNGFFAISGFLIAGSWTRSRSAYAYFIRRIFRIFPAFWLSLVLTAFVFAPLSTLGFQASASWLLPDGINYVIKNASLYVSTHTIGNTLASANYPNSWNGSLWTLAPEFICYTLLALFFQKVKRHRLLFAFLGFFFAALASALVSLPEPVESALRVGIYFLAGTIIFMARERVSFSLPIFILCLIVIFALWPQAESSSLIAFPLAYVLLWIGSYPKCPAFFHKNDYSYGLYVFAFPIQQLVEAFHPQLNLLWHVLFSLSFAAAIASLSWHFIENPMMKLGRKMTST